MKLGRKIKQRTHPGARDTREIYSQYEMFARFEQNQQGSHEALQLSLRFSFYSNPQLL